MKKYLVIYHSTKKIECLTILWWVLVLFFVHLTSRLASNFNCTFYHAFTLEGQLHFSCSKNCLQKLYNVIDSNGFDVSTQCITYVMVILPFPNCVDETYEYIPLGQANITFNNGCHAMLSQRSKQLVVPYFWIEFCIFSITYLDTSTLDCFNKPMYNPWYDKGL
jgi:hypothetical protein